MCEQGHVRQRNPSTCYVTQSHENNMPNGPSQLGDPLYITQRGFNTIPMDPITISAIFIAFSQNIQALYQHLSIWTNVELK